MGPVLVVRFDQLAAVLAPAPVLERPSGRRALDAQPCLLHATSARTVFGPYDEAAT
jgi:hypothetical protein